MTTNEMIIGGFCVLHTCFNFAAVILVIAASIKILFFL